jgi:hypothetical protein
MPLVKLDPEAFDVYQNLDRLCAEQYGGHIVGNHVAGEVRRIITGLITDPTQVWLQRHRIPQDDGTIVFAVVIRTPKDVESEAAVFWKLLDVEESPDDVESAWVLAIELDYRR